MKILIVTSSHHQLGETGRKTGIWLGELAIPYYIFKEAGADITLASPLGGITPVDPRSESVIASTSTTRRFQKDLEVIDSLKHSLPLATLKAFDFDMVFLPGGHAAIWDFPGNQLLARLLEDFSRQGKVIGLVSYAASILLSMKASDGEPFIKGKSLTALSNTEVKGAGLATITPFSLESTLTDGQAYFSKAQDHICHTVVDGRIVTGQNEASSGEVAQKMLRLLKEISYSRPAPLPY